MKSKALRFAILAGLVVLLCATCALGAVVYVKPTGKDTNNGSSWAYAKLTVQAGISAAASGGEVWVAAGTYPQAITLKSGVGLYGGFAGTEALRTQRRPATYATYLDGGGADTVVTAPAGATAATVIDGFTIRNGRGASGGGIYAADSAITISNNTISDNKAFYYGGGIYGEASTLTIIGNTLTRNRAAFGGGIACYDSDAPTITCNRIYSNTSDYDGSGIYCYSNSTPVIASNLIYANTAASEGAGVYCDDAAPVIVNNTISDNNATTHGGGLACLDSSPTIANNIIAFGSSGIRSVGIGSPTVRNNIVTGNAAYGYSGLSAGTDDLSTDPAFVNRTARDYHLGLNSLAINAGWNEAPGVGSTDADGSLRIQGGAIDIGAHEFANLPPALASLTGAKSAPVNSWVRLGATAVSAAFPGVFYIQTDDRVAGIRVEKAGHSVAQGQRAIVEGVVRTNSDGERYLYAVAVSADGVADVRPMFMTNRSVGGGAPGLGNIGLLVRTSGVCHYIAPDTFTVDDGSGVTVKCVTTAGVTVQPSWGFASVTGVSSCERVGGEIKRLLRVRSQNDIQAF